MKDIEKVSLEIQQAREKYGYFNSTHEVYGVLIEKVEEFFHEVKKKTIPGNENIDEFSFAETKKRRIIHELTQIAAISLRAIDELRHDKIKWI